MHDDETAFAAIRARVLEAIRVRVRGRVQPRVLEAIRVRVRGRARDQPRVWEAPVALTLTP